ncbi:hypothetical protein DFS33DRAFT_276434 [Desarmillaria ectypa]|nr:hypothetical protein DFS33DRAFT_276434 [Desarmillaria ectypa]
MIVTTIQVTNFTEDRIVDMTFNYTSLSEKDCNVVAWPPEFGYISDMLQLALFSMNYFRPLNAIAKSEPFSGTSGSRNATSGSESITSKSTFSSTLPSPTTSSPTSSVPGTAQLTKKAIPTNIIVGAVIGSRRRNRSLEESALSRAFWRQLDRKGPPISQSVQQPLPAYAQGKDWTYQRPVVRPLPLKLDEYCLHAGKM